MLPYFHGFKTLDDYYAATSALGRLYKVRVPVFFLGSLDDPVVHRDTYAIKEIENNDMVIAGYTKRGGHCGHFSAGFSHF